jgi:hypothetical protein
MVKKKIVAETTLTRKNQNGTGPALVSGESRRAKTNTEAWPGWTKSSWKTLIHWESSRTGWEDRRTERREEMKTGCLLHSEERTRAGHDPEQKLRQQISHEKNKNGTRAEQ